MPNGEKPALDSEAVAKLIASKSISEPQILRTLGGYYRERISWELKHRSLPLDTLPDDDADSLVSSFVFEVNDRMNEYLEDMNTAAESITETMIADHLLEIVERLETWFFARGNGKLNEIDLEAPPASDEVA